MKNDNLGREKFYAGGFLYNPKTKSVLLHKRDSKAKINPNNWAFFGGASEEGETPKQTFARELEEELNIKITEERIIPISDYMNEEFQIYKYVFFVESDLDKFQMKLSEGEDFDWIPLNKVFDYIITKKSVEDLKTFLQIIK